jgi:hypothetical protein
VFVPTKGDVSAGQTVTTEFAINVADTAHASLNACASRRHKR